MQNSLSRRLFAEALGVFGIVFFGCGAAMVAERYPGSFPPGGVALVFGLIVCALVYMLGHISGAHLNPAVTIAFAAVKRFSWKEVGPYWLAQYLGGFAAILVLANVLPAGTGFGATVISVSPGQALAWEFLMTFFLMFAVLSVATDSRAVGFLAGVVVGVVVALEALVGGVVTGTSLNPARTLAPNWMVGRLDVFWIYLVGPIAGAVVAALIYEWIRADAPATVMVDSETPEPAPA